MSKKITELDAIASVDDADVLPIVDVSGTATTKKVTVAQLVAMVPEPDPSVTLGGNVGDVLLKSSATATSGVAPGTEGDVLMVNSSGAWVSGRWLAGCCTLEQFGAVGDGSTSDNAAMAAAIAALTAGTYSTILLGAKTYLVGGPYTVPAGCSIVGFGDESVLKTATDDDVLFVGGNDTGFHNFRILGSSSGSSQVGIRNGTDGSSGSGYERCFVSNVNLENLGADGFAFYASPANGGFGPMLSNVRATGCGTGFRFGVRGEYANLTNCSAAACTLGAYIAGGNVSWTGGNLSRNVKGLTLATGDNHAHGVFSGVQINHSSGGTAIEIEAITLGHDFIGCHVYDGAITSAGAGVRFVGCEISSTAITTTTYHLTFEGCLVIGTPTITENSSGQVHFPNCRGIDGKWPSVGRRATGVMHWSGELLVGTDPNYSSTTQCTGLRMYAQSIGYMGIGSSSVAYWNSTSFNFVQPIGGGTQAFKFKAASITFASANYTISGTEIEAVYLTLGGTTGGARDLILPSTTNATYNVRNDTADTITAKKSGGTGVAIAAGTSLWVRYNGSDYEKRTETGSGGSPGGSNLTFQFKDDTTFDGCSKLRSSSATGASSVAIAEDMRQVGRPALRTAEQEHEPYLDEDGSLSTSQTSTGPTFAWDYDSGEAPEFSKRHFLGGIVNTSATSSGTVMTVTGIPPYGYLYVDGVVTLGRVNLDEADTSGVVLMRRILHLESGAGASDQSSDQPLGTVGTEIGLTVETAWNTSSHTLGVSYEDFGPTNGDNDGSIRIVADLTFRWMAVAPPEV